jgi:hypothetical protein
MRVYVLEPHFESCKIDRNFAWRVVWEGEGDFVGDNYPGCGGYFGDWGMDVNYNYMRVVKLRNCTMVWGRWSYI